MSRFTPFSLRWAGAFAAGAALLLAGSPPADPEIARRLQAFVADGTLAGAVTLVADRERILSLEATGWADLADRTPMTPDHLFWIASMTKPMTAVAVLQLQDEGRLHIDDPVENYLPEFRNPWLASAADADSVTLVRPARPVTIRDLLTHTSGLADVPAPRPDASLEALVMAYAQAPLRFPPGSKWEYCNSGINTLGRLVEVVSGERIEAYLQRRLFDPLGMTDTTFWPTAEQAARLAKTYR